MLDIQTNRLYKTRLPSSKLCLSDILSASEGRIGTGMDGSILEAIGSATVTKIYGSVKTILKEKLSPAQRKFQV